MLSPILLSPHQAQRSSKRKTRSKQRRKQACQSDEFVARQIAGVREPKTLAQYAQQSQDDFVASCNLATFNKHQSTFRKWFVFCAVTGCTPYITHASPAPLVASQGEGYLSFLRENGIESGDSLIRYTRAVSNLHKQMGLPDPWLRAPSVLPMAAVLAKWLDAHPVKPLRRKKMLLPSQFRLLLLSCDMQNPADRLFRCVLMICLFLGMRAGDFLPLSAEFDADTSFCRGDVSMQTESVSGHPLPAHLLLEFRATKNRRMRVGGCPALFKPVLPHPNLPWGDLHAALIAYAAEVCHPHMRFPFFVNWDFTASAWGSTPFTVSQFRAKLNERMRLLFPNSMGVGVHTFRILTNTVMVEHQHSESFSAEDICMVMDWHSIEKKKHVGQLYGRTPPLRMFSLLDQIHLILMNAKVWTVSSAQYQAFLGGNSLD